MTPTPDGAARIALAAIGPVPGDGPITFTLEAATIQARLLAEAIRTYAAQRAAEAAAEMRRRAAQAALDNAMNQYSATPTYDLILALPLPDGAAAPAERVGWQAIATAPKDGTRVLLTSTRLLYAVVGYYGPWEDSEPAAWRSDWDNESLGVELPYDYTPTHWMPLPAAPSPTEEPPHE